ncbi:MAG: sugar kinase [Deltaproteobacteria bacterium]|nr:sugar kinase [Deltaproteobacteria bacterium]
MQSSPSYDITNDDVARFGRGPALVAFGEVMVRDTPADLERPERTRLVRLSMAGSEYTLAIGLARLGIPTGYITRVPDNPYGRAVRNIARENGVDTGHIVWAAKTEPIGRFIYEIGRTPRRDTGVYQRQFSAASRLDAGMVDWKSALAEARLLHTSGITFGLAAHSRYDRNYNWEAFKEAVATMPEGCLVGLDFNYRGTLWSVEQAREVMTPIVGDHVDVLITTIEDMALLYGIGCGRYSARQIVDGEMDRLEDDDIRAFAEQVHRKFDTRIVAITIRYPDSFEQHRWESAAVHADGTFFRSPTVRSITLWDRLGGGDTWNAGFYYGLLTADFGAESIAKGVLVGDAATRLKQTLMFDLPIIGRDEVQALMKADQSGGGKRTSR